MCVFTSLTGSTGALQDMKTTKKVLVLDHGRKLLMRTTGCVRHATSYLYLACYCDGSYH